MEGVADYLTRQLITAAGGYDLCVTEFIRITDTVYPKSVFYRLCPELRHGSRTLGGTPVHAQLLGNHPELMARNAQRVAEMGARGVDINFGCPAKMVNRHKGGAALLKEPETIYQVVKAVREHVDSEIPVTAKMRLGYDDSSQALEIAQGIEEAGAEGLTIHARTRKEGYRPPAHWEKLAIIREKLNIPLTANGEIWTVDDYMRCREVSGCDHIMIGRGAVSRPLLGRDIKNVLATPDSNPQSVDTWPATHQILLKFAEQTLSIPPEDVHLYGIVNPARYLADRLKQWLRMMGRGHEQADPLFHRIKRMTCAQDILQEFKKAAP